MTDDCSGFFDNMQELILRNGVTDTAAFASELLQGYEDYDDVLADFEYFWPTTRLTIRASCNDVERKPKFQIKD